jgi:uncharacterized protein (TIGR02271 family)
VRPNSTSAKPIILPRVEETLAVGKRKVPTATVRVKKLVRERIAAVDAPLLREDVVVERVPVDRIVAEPIPPRRTGDTLVLSVIEEVLVKQLRLVEEVRITTRRRLERHRTTMPLRREDVVVERSQPAAAGPRRLRRR